MGIATRSGTGGGGEVAKPSEARGEQRRKLLSTVLTFRTCKRFLEAVAGVAEIAWQDQKAAITTNQFFIEYSQYIDNMRRSCTGGGIADSWRRCYEGLIQDGHAVMIS